MSLFASGAFSTHLNKRLLDRGYRTRRPVRRPRLTDEHHRLRLNRHDVTLILGNGAMLFSTDESRFLLYRFDGILRVRCLRRERFYDDCVEINVPGRYVCDYIGWDSLQR